MKAFVYAITPENMDLAIRKGVVAVKRNLEAIQDAKVGDKILFYESAPTTSFVAVGKVIKRVYRGKKKIWREEIESGKIVYPYRLNVRVLRLKQPLNVQAVVSRLSFIKNKKKYGGYFRIPLFEIKKKDFSLILKAKANSSPTTRQIGNTFHDRVESLFVSLGFKIISSDYNRKGADIIISDEETGKKILVQCKATLSEVSPTFPNLERLILEYDARAKREGADRSLIALGGYSIGDSDWTEILRENGVALFPLQLIEYYEDLIGKIGSFAKYQFLSDAGIRVPFDEEISIPCIKVDQSNHSFYVLSLSPDWLLKSSAVLRRIAYSTKVTGYQRILNKGRVKKDLPKFFTSGDWVLPNTIICVTEEELFSRYNPITNTLRLPSRVGLFWVMDGQHRLYSFSNTDDSTRKQANLVCALFDTSVRGLPSNEAQAKVFVQINQNATKVEKNLFFELSELLGTDKPWVEVATKMVRHKLFRNLIRTYSQKIGQMTLVALATDSSLKALLSEKSPLARQFKKMNPVEVCFTALISYFSVVKDVFSKEWGSKDSILLDNRGFGALLFLYVRILSTYHYQPSKIEKYTRGVLLALKSSPFDFKAETHSGLYLGAGGPAKLGRDWVRNIRLKLADFDPDWRDDEPEEIPDIPKEEGQGIELKSTLSWDLKKNCRNDGLRHAVLKSVCAFLNTNSGKLVIGVNDSGEILGLSSDYALLNPNQSLRDQFSRQINSLIRSSIGDYEASLVRISFLEKDGKDVCIISVQKSDKPAFFNGSEFYIRLNAETKEIRGRDFVDYLKQKFKSR